MTSLAFLPHALVTQEIAFERADIRFPLDQTTISVLGTSTYATLIEYGDDIRPVGEKLDIQDWADALEINEVR